MSACMSCDESEVEALLSKGASVDTAALDGLTALHQVRMASFLGGSFEDAMQKRDCTSRTRVV